MSTPKRQSKKRAEVPTPNAFHGVTTSHAVAPAAHADDGPQLTDAERYEALAREHGADLDEDGFNKVLGKVRRSKKTN